MALKLYLCGNLVYPERFSHASKKDRQRFAALLVGIDKKIFHNLLGGDNLDLLKQDILRNTKNARSKKLRQELARVVIGRISMERAQRLAHELSREWKQRQGIVMDYLRSLPIHRRAVSYTAFTMPAVGEASNVVGNVLVIGVDAPRKIAFGLLLEELLHAALIAPPKKSFGMSQVSDWLFNEAYTGAHLYRLLGHLGYSQKMKDSLVFGWWNGKRTKLVRKILAKMCIN